MTDLAAEARDSALHCEAKKHAYRQTQDGVVVSFVLHPQEVPEGLAVASLGTRYMLALVEIGDDEKPVQKPNPLLQRACILCGEMDFQHFLSNQFPSDWRQLTIMGTGDDSNIAAEIVRSQCGVRSRKEIVPNSEAAVAFEKLSSLYFKWLNL